MDHTDSTDMQYYTVQSGDYCAKLESSFAITMSQLQLWNPALKSDCSNLVLGEAYCVQGAPSASTKLKLVRAEPTPGPLSGRAANRWFEEAYKLL